MASESSFSKAWKRFVDHEWIKIQCDLKRYTVCPPVGSEQASRALAQPALSLSPQAPLNGAPFPSWLSRQCRVTETSCVALGKGGWQPPVASYVHPRRRRFLLDLASNPVSHRKRAGRFLQAVVLATTTRRVAAVIS